MKHLTLTLWFLGNINLKSKAFMYLKITGQG